ncbi:hypothetical protein KC350_g42 [Hortaea werneckii]|nr:hypothetical protein KC350_g42 [Hortaea werneckii]
MAVDRHRYPSNTPPATTLDSLTISSMRQSDECLHPSKPPQAVQDVDPKLAFSSYALGMLLSVLVSLSFYPCRETPLPIAAPRQSPPPRKDRLMWRLAVEH